MIVASFLTKDLRLSWLEGARWFWDTLVDADLANNSMGWQWAAGCGADAAPYFRIFNPDLQSEKFDPLGLYIKKWIPELKAVAPKTLHNSNSLVAKNYPRPIVSHAEARRDALAAYKTLSKSLKNINKTGSKRINHVENPCLHKSNHTERN